MPDPFLKAKLVNKLMPIDFVTFDFNPKTLTVKSGVGTTSRGSASSNTGAPAGSLGNLFRRREPTTFSFTALLDDEAALVPIPGEVKRKIDLMIAWLAPGPSSLLGALAGAAVAAIASIGSSTPARMNLSSKQPVITFQWGPPRMGFLVDGVLSSVSAKYQRFTAEGLPTRAEVDVTLKEEPSIISQMLTNPTSGGKPGRKAHVVEEGESLQTIAVKNYGRPGAWRAVAAINGIDDPLRVRPGTTLFLPAPQELEYA